MDPKAAAEKTSLTSKTKDDGEDRHKDRRLSLRKRQARSSNTFYKHKKTPKRGSPRKSTTPKPQMVGSLFSRSSSTVTIPNTLPVETPSGPPRIMTKRVSIPRHNQPPPPEVLQPPFPGLNSGVNNNAVACGFNPVLWSGMKNIRDGDIDNILYENQNTQFVLVAWSPNRRMTTNPDNDIFFRSFIEPPFRDKGNVIFFCEGGRVVRCHAVLLHAILPEFTKELSEMASFPYSAYVVELPYIPIFVKGVEQRCIEHLVHLIYRGVAVLTGRDIQKLVQVLQVLSINELNVCIAPGPGGLNPNGEGWPNGMAGGQQQPPHGFEHGPNDPYEMLEPTGNFVNNEGQQLMAGLGPFQAPDPVTIVRAQLKVKKHASADDSATSTSESGDDGDGEIKDNENKDLNRKLDSEIPSSSQPQSQYSQSATTATSQKSTEPPQVSQSIFQTGGGREIDYACLPLIPPPLPDKIVVGSLPVMTPLGDKIRLLSGDDPNKVVEKTPVRRKRRSTNRNRTKSEGNNGTPQQLPVSQIPDNPASPSDPDDDDDENDKKKRKRTVYPKGMRSRALSALNEGLQVRDVALKLRVPPKLISRWKYEAKKADDVNIPCVTINDENVTHEGKEEVVISAPYVDGSGRKISDSELAMKGNVMMENEPFMAFGSFLKIKQEPMDYYEQDNSMHNSMYQHVPNTLPVHQQVNQTAFHPNKQLLQGTTPGDDDSQSQDVSQASQIEMMNATEVAGADSFVDKNIQNAQHH